MAWRARKRSSIAGSFITIILLILMVGQGSLWAWFLYTQKRHNMRMLEDKVQTVARFLSDTASHAAASGSYDEIRHQAETALKDEDLLLVKISDRSGGLLAEAVREGPGEDSGFFNPFFVPMRNTLKEPLTNEDGEEFGVMEIQYSGAKPNEVMTGLLTVPPLGQLFVFLFMIRIIYFFFQRNVGRPIGLLKDRLENITGGDLTVDVPDAGADEIGDIGKGLKFLVERLSVSVTRLSATAKNLTAALQKLDLMFKNLGDAIRKQSISIDEIVSSLRSANDSQKQIGQSTVELFESSSDNFSILLEVKKTSEDVVALSSRLFQASDDSYSTVAEMSQTAKMMAQNAQSVLSSVDDTLGAVSKILASVREVEKSAKDSSELAENVRELASERGVLVVSETIESMGKISGSVKFSADVVRSLGSRSKDVEKMLAVIKEVTEQTNLLSLNAAILAQQAGEYGKGFSVVADEMRGLSDRTAASTKEIAGIIKTIQTEIKDAVKSIEAGRSMADEGNELAFKVAETMGAIVEAARKSANMAMTIERATEQQAKGLGQIAFSMDTVSKMASKMSHATDEQFRGSDYMLNRVSDVREIAEVTKRNIEKQAERTREISRNLETANDKVSKINRSAATQQTVNDGIISAVETIRGLGTATIKDVQFVSASLSALHEEISKLSREMERFRVK